MEALLPLVFAFGVMWLLMIRPQQRRLRQHQALVAALQPGDEVVTGGGLCGTVVSVDDDVLQIEIAPGVSVRVLRSAVSQRIGPADEEPDAEQPTITDEEV
ncbi:MAG: preprotein translocase subunit YajC [Acidimicrobiales bacterium]